MEEHVDAFELLTVNSMWAIHEKKTTMKLQLRTQFLILEYIEIIEVYAWFTHLWFYISILKWQYNGSICIFLYSQSDVNIIEPCDGIVDPLHAYLV